MVYLQSTKTSCDLRNRVELGQQEGVWSLGSCDLHVKMTKYLSASFSCPPNAATVLMDDRTSSATAPALP